MEKGDLNSSKITCFQGTIYVNSRYIEFFFGLDFYFFRSAPLVVLWLKIRERNNSFDFGSGNSI